MRLYRWRQSNFAKTWQAALLNMQLHICMWSSCGATGPHMQRDMRRYSYILGKCALIWRCMALTGAANYAA